MPLGGSLPALLPDSSGSVQPLDTAQEIADFLVNANAGDIGEIASGTYPAPVGSSNGRYTLGANSGDAGNPITLRAASGATVALRPTVSAGHEVLTIASGASAAKYWKFEGIIFELAGTGSNYQNVYVAGTGAASTDIEFWNCEVRLAQQGTGAFVEEGAQRIYWINCSIHDNYDTAVPGTQRQGLYLTGNNCMALNCVSYNHEGFGFQVRTNDADGPDSVIVANCVAYNNLGIVNPGTEFAGFFTEEAADNCQFRNNIAVGNRNGFRGLVGPGGTPSPHNQAVWNISNGNVNTNYGRQASSDALDYALDGSGDYVGPGDNLTSDPLLTDPANDDFTLQEGSPAYGYGDEAYCPTFDRNNNTRLTVTAGAYRAPEEEGTPFIHAPIMGGGF